MKKKICWVTPDSFVDCDNNPEILTEILKVYNIHWIIILPLEGARFKESDFKDLADLSGLTITFLYTKVRQRDPRMLIFYEKLYKKILEIKSDLVYFNYVPETPYILPLYWRLNKEKTIFTAHDGTVNKAFKFSFITKITFFLAYNFILNVNMFSNSQAKLFKKNFGKKNIFVIPLTLKEFGESKLDVTKNNDIVIFGFFGTIHYGKNLGLLIEAACSLYEDGVTNFKININGNCDHWETYERNIKYPNLFELNIRHIENSEIPDIFTRCHFIVFPYKVMSQSGALKVAFNYNVPVIVSDLDGFKDEVADNVNGYIFKSENAMDLKEKMKIAIHNFKKDYEEVCYKVKTYNYNNYSNLSISQRYLQMFEKVL